MSVTVDPVRAPRGLSTRSRRFWNTITAEWSLDVQYLELLRQCCQAMDRVDEARTVLEREGLTVVDRYGQTKPHPCVNVERDARIAVARLIRELNLSESAEEPRPPRLRYAG